MSVPTIALSGVGFSYPDGRRALDGVDLHIHPGERVALLGPNGAGKTTLVLHLNGILLPQEGAIEVAGIPVTREHFVEVRRRVGIVFQDPDDQLIGLTVGEDVGYGPRARRWPPAEVDRAVGDALRSVSLDGYEHRSPHHLSTGEKRRVCLAGVLACRPGLLLLDEPSSGLDPRGRRSLAALLGNLAATIIVASHDLAFIRQVCSRVIVLDGGIVAAGGPAGELLGDEALLSRHGLT